MTTSKLLIAGGKVGSAVALALAAALLWCAAPASAQNIGSAAAIRNDVHGIRGTATRPLAAGGAVYNDDEVKTGNDSLAQLLFVDQSTFSVASNSEAILKNIYHGKQGVGQRVLSAVAGAFRYVSGVQTSNTRINFPYGYLTVRGTIVDLLIWPGRNVIILVEGAITVVPYATNIAHDMDRPGTFIIVYQDGHVDGPMTWDTTIMKVTDKVPFPLFGTTIWPGQETFEQWDDRMFLNDIARSSGSSSSSSSSVQSSGACPAGLVQYFSSVIGNYCSTP
jgi:FecR protein